MLISAHNITVPRRRCSGSAFVFRRFSVWVSLGIPYAWRTFRAFPHSLGTRPLPSQSFHCHLLPVMRTIKINMLVCPSQLLRWLLSSTCSHHSVTSSDNNDYCWTYVLIKQLTKQPIHTPPRTETQNKRLFIFLLYHRKNVAHISEACFILGTDFAILNEP
jgi:hypothetical protein